MTFNQHMTLKLKNYIQLQMRHENASLVSSISGLLVRRAREMAHTRDPAPIWRNSPHSDNARLIDQKLIVGGRKQGDNRKTSRPSGAGKCHYGMVYLEMTGRGKNHVWRICRFARINEPRTKYLAKRALFLVKNKKKKKIRKSPPQYIRSAIRSRCIRIKSMIFH